MATRSVIPDYWIWVYWVSPIAWVLRSFVVNEYLAPDYTEGDSCSGMPCAPCAYAVSFVGGNTSDPALVQAVTGGQSCGQYFLAARQFQTEPYWVWVGIGVLWAYAVLALMASALVLTYVRFDEARGEDDAGSTAGEVASNDDDVEGGGKMDTALPFTEVTLTFQRVRYTLELPGAPDESGRVQLHPVDLLKGVSGYAEPCKMTALMGSSGAGKTTLLDVLASRKTQGKISGGIFVNGAPKDDATFIRMMGYVEQFGVHSEASTVYESLLFSAALRLPKGTSKRNRDKIVRETIELLELEPIRDKLVGHQGTAGALSFEEIKRLTIGVELVANPSVIFLDEPTSGLDARAATIVMSGMRKIASTGRAIICTIHQPSTAIFNKFDSLLLMKRGGEVVFFGPLGPGSANLKEYFLQYPGTPPCDADTNPATWMLAVIGAGTGGGDTIDFAAAYRGSELGVGNEADITSRLAQFKSSSASLVEPSTGFEVDALMQLRATLLGGEDDMVSMSAQIRWLFWCVTHAWRRELPSRLPPTRRTTLNCPSVTGWTQSARRRAEPLTRVLRSVWRRRNFLEYWRTPSYSLVRWVITAFFGLVIGSTFFQNKITAVADVQSLVTAIGFGLQFLGIYNLCERHAGPVHATTASEARPKSCGEHFVWRWWRGRVHAGLPPL